MRVLHLLSSTGYHGAENMAAQLIRDLSARGIDNYVGTFRNNEESSTEILGVVRDVVKDGVVFPCRGKLDLGTILSLREYIRVQGIELIHSHKYKTNLYAAVARIGMKCVLVGTCHNWLVGDAKMRFYAALDKRVIRAFDKVVGVSGEVADELRKYAGHAKTVKIDNGVDVTRFRSSISRDDAKKSLGLNKRPVIGFVGRLSPDKGISYLLRSARLLKDQGVEFEVLIVGEGDFFRALHDEAVHLGIAEQVRFLGRRDDMPRVYAAMDVFVLPSRKEAFPMVVLEAMAAGIPVIATRVGDVPYILNEGECGVLVEQEDVPALSDAIRNLIGDQAAMRRVALSGQRRARDCFSSEAMAGRYRELYAQAWAERYGAD